MHHLPEEIYEPALAAEQGLQEVLSHAVSVERYTRLLQESITNRGHYTSNEATFRLLKDLRDANSLLNIAAAAAAKHASLAAAMQRTN